MDWDISRILEAWNFETGDVMVRRFVGKDGIEKIQMRIDLGILQMNATGRPDGKTPCGKTSYLEYLESKLETHETDQKSDDQAFRLKQNECYKLQQEAIQYHHRYICYFQLEDYTSVIRDTNRNLKAINFAMQYSPSEEYTWSLRQLTPQLLMMRTRAAAAQSLEQDEHDQAIAYIKSGLDQLRNFYHSISRDDLVKESNEILALEAWQKDIKEQRPLSPLEKLEHELNEAIRQENFERAAEVRDEIRNFDPASGNPQDN